MKATTHPNTDLALRRLRKKVPTLYEADVSKYAGPNPLQVTRPAKWLRQFMRPRAYTQWLDQAFNHVDVIGSHYLEKISGPCVLIGNHTSHLDTLLVDAALPATLRQRTFFGAAQDRWFIKGKKKKELQPWYQSLVLGNFPIMRGGGTSALRYAHWLLEQGQCVFLFPEGTRATGDTLGEFKHGATMLALEHDIPVVPIYLHGAQAARPKGTQKVIRGQATVEILNPVHFSTGCDLTAATQRLQERLTGAHQRYRKVMALQDAA